MPIQPLIPGYTANNQQNQIYPWFGQQSSPNGLRMINGATVTIYNGATAAIVPGMLGSTGSNTGVVQNFIQTGTTVGTPNASGDLTITFLNPFPTALDTVVICNGDVGNNPTQMSGWNPGAGFDVSHFVCRNITSTTGAAIASSIRVNWIAIGH